MNIKELKEAAEKAIIGGTREDAPDVAQWLEVTTLERYQREANPSTILSLIARLERMEEALRLVTASASSVLAELKPGQSLHPAGATKTNILESDVNYARRALETPANPIEEVGNADRQD